MMMNGLQLKQMKRHRDESSDKEHTDQQNNNSRLPKSFVVVE
jgi:hypothetical protein